VPPSPFFSAVRRIDAIGLPFEVVQDRLPADALLFDRVRRLCVKGFAYRDTIVARDELDQQQPIAEGILDQWAGLLALVNESLGTNVGYVNPLLYSAKVEATFHDIAKGSNGDYSAGSGWDACTGLGSPNGAALVTVLRGD
jgi:hypothetical protein